MHSASMQAAVQMLKNEACAGYMASSLRRRSRRHDYCPQNERLKSEILLCTELAIRMHYLSAIRFQEI